MLLKLFILLLTCILGQAETFNEFKNRCEAIPKVTGMATSQKNAIKLVKSQLADSLYGVHIDSTIVDIAKEVTHNGITNSDIIFEASSSINTKAFLYLEFSNQTSYSIDAKIICHKMQYKKYSNFINNNETFNEEKEDGILNWQDEKFIRIDIDNYSKNEPSYRVKNYTNAKNYCSNLILNGKTNWRLPSIKEFETIINTKGSININNNRVYINRNLRNILPKVGKDKTLKFWAINENNHNESSYIDFFNYGLSAYENQDNNNYVICVN